MSVVALQPMANPFPTGSTVAFKVPGAASLPGAGFNWGGALSVAGSLVSSVVSIKANDQQIKQQKLALQQQIEAGKASLAAQLQSLASPSGGSSVLSGSGGMIALGVAGAVVLGLLLSRGAPVNYTVKSGDTLSRIASAYGVTVAALQAANGIADVNKISTGQVLTIPATGVTLNAAGQVLPPPTATGVSSGNWWDGLANVFQVGAQSWNSIKQAEFARKQARAEGTPISPYLGNEVTGVQPQAGPSEGTKALVGGAFFLLLGVMVGGLFAGSSQTARNRNR